MKAAYKHDLILKKAIDWFNKSCVSTVSECDINQIYQCGDSLSVIDKRSVLEECVCVDMFMIESAETVPFWSSGGKTNETHSPKLYMLAILQLNYSICSQI